MESLKQVIDKYDELAREYDRRYVGEGASLAFKLYLGLYDQLTWRYIEPYLPQDLSMPILDAGGGTGKWALRIAEQGHQDVQILDLSSEMLEQAEEHFAACGLGSALTTQVGDIRDLPWPENTFGLVVSEGDPVGYCLSDYPIAISEMVRVCIPGGMIVIAVDDLLSQYLGALQMVGLEEAVKLRETRVSRCPYDLPVRCFTPREMQETFSAAGADVIKILTKPSLMHILRNIAKLADNPALQQALFEAEVWACEEGYVTGGSHLQVIARKRNGLSGRED